MRPLRISRLHLQSRSYTRGFKAYQASSRQFEEDHKHPLQSCPVQPSSTLPKDEGESYILNERPCLEFQASGSLTGKQAIITGASRGIGAAIAEQFAKEGARCVLVGRNVHALTQVREGLARLHKAEHVVKVGDVGNLDFWKDMARSEVSA